MRAERLIGVTLIGSSAVLTGLVAVDAIAPALLAGAVAALLAGIAILVLRS